MSDLSEMRKRVTDAMAAIQTTNDAGTVTVTTIRYGEHGAVIRGRVVNFAKRNYCGVPVYTWEVRERGAYSRRSRYHWWLGKAEHQSTAWEAGTLTVNSVRGNVDRDTYEVLADTRAIVIEGLTLS